MIIKEDNTDYIWEIINNIRSRSYYITKIDDDEQLDFSHPYRRRIITIEILEGIRNE